MKRHPKDRLCQFYEIKTKPKYESKYFGKGGGGGKKCCTEPVRTSKQHQPWKTRFGKCTIMVGWEDGKIQVVTLLPALCKKTAVDNNKREGLSWAVTHHQCNRLSSRKVIVNRVDWIKISHSPHESGLKNRKQWS